MQSKICLSVLEDCLGTEQIDQKLLQVLINMWAMSGDFISKIYAGTSSVLTQLTIKGKENMFD